MHYGSRYLPACVAVLALVAGNLGAVQAPALPKANAGRPVPKDAQDEAGHVIYARIVSSELNDDALEEVVEDRVRRYFFDKHDGPPTECEISLLFRP